MRVRFEICAFGLVALLVCGQCAVQSAPPPASPGAPAPLLTGVAGSAAATGTLVGTWVGSNGATYELSPAGNDLAWAAVGRYGGHERGQVLVDDAATVRATWGGDWGPGSATGRVMADATGQPTRIEWSNGVTFTRAPSSANAPPAASAEPTLAGRWIGNNHVAYDVTSNGSAFAWTCRTPGGGHERGQILVDDRDTVRATWSGDAGSGTATGRVVRGEGGRPMRIEWSNGVTFTYAQP
jgi:hypothetical protein